MAKKSRTPPPPRPVQAPRRRESTTGGGWSKRTLGIAAAVVVAVGIAIGLGVALTGGGGGGGDPTKKLAAAGCTLKTYPDQGRAHVQSLEAKVNYNSFPPTSGPHYFEPAIWGAYDQPLVLVQEVHNLEHGGVTIQYGSGVSQSTVVELRDFYNDSPNGLLLAPLPKLGDKIALTAWTHLATCTGFDKSAFAAFRSAYRGKGPERFPVSALTPGS